MKLDSTRKTIAGWSHQTSRRMVAPKRRRVSGWGTSAMARASEVRKAIGAVRRKANSSAVGAALSMATPHGHHPGSVPAGPRHHVLHREIRTAPELRVGAGAVAGGDEAPTLDPIAPQLTMLEARLTHGIDDPARCLRRLRRVSGAIAAPVLHR